MDTRFLTYFLKIAQEGNLTRAAEKLHITQPTLSRQLMDMEEQLGVQFFIRGKRSLILTEAGLLYQQRAQEIVELIQKTERDLKGPDSYLSGRISIGCVESSVSKVVAKWTSDFIKQYPQVQFDIYSANGDDLRERLDQGLIDCAFVLEPIETAKYSSVNLSLFEKQGLILPSQHPLTSKGYVEAIDLIDLPLMISRRSIVLDDVLDWLDIDSNKLNFVGFHNLISNSLEYAKLNIGFSITIEGALAIRPVDGLSFVPFKPEKRLNHIFAWKKNRLQSQAAQMFIEAIINNSK